MSFTNKEVETIKETYLAALSSGEAASAVKSLAESLNRTERSIIAKLSAMKVYVAKERTSKLTGEKPKTKQSYVKDIELILECKPLSGLEKAPKQTLIYLKDQVEEWLGPLPDSN